MRHFSFLSFLFVPLALVLAPHTGYAEELRKQDSFKVSCGKLLMALMNTGERGARTQLSKAQKYNGAPDEFMPTPENAPWAANYFPMTRGGIASRWQGEMAAYKLLNDGPDEIPLTQAQAREKVLGLTPAELKVLSPTEKYDILRGDYAFKTTRWELRHRGPARTPAPKGWEGFCNAMRAAGCLAPEPVRAIHVKSRDGVEVELLPADIKALFGATHFYVEKYTALGTPHFGAGLDVDPPNPAAFHTALNALALRGKLPMVIDMKNVGNELWNETVVGYSRRMTEPRALSEAEKLKAPAAASKIVEVDLELRALAEVSMTDTNRATQANVAAGRLGINRLPYRYKLYIDETGKVLEGEWSGDAWPDFVWFPYGKGADADYKGNPNLDYDTLRAWVEESSK
jgi:hypothetical protein